MAMITDFTYSSPLKLALLDNLAQFLPIKRSNEAPKAAAVAITIYEDQNEAAVIITKRSPRLNAHTGQWAIPGGRLDKGESCHSGKGHQGRTFRSASLRLEISGKW